MTRLIVVALLSSACSVVDPETACFDLASLPSADEVVVGPAEPDIDYPHRPQTPAAAEQAMWDRLHALFRGSSAPVRCLIDEGTIACEPATLEVAWQPAPLAYFACRWQHPEGDHVPHTWRHFQFFPDGPASPPPGTPPPTPPR